MGPPNRWCWPRGSHGPWRRTRRPCRRPNRSWKPPEVEDALAMPPPPPPNGGAALRFLPLRLIIMLLLVVVVRLLLRHPPTWHRPMYRLIPLHPSLLLLHLHRLLPVHVCHKFRRWPCVGLLKWDSLRAVPTRYLPFLFRLCGIVSAKCSFSLIHYCQGPVVKRDEHTSGHGVVADAR